MGRFVCLASFSPCVLLSESQRVVVFNIYLVSDDLVSDHLVSDDLVSDHLVSDHLVSDLELKISLLLRFADSFKF